MARRTQTYAIRLAVEGGGQVKAELVSVGQSGEQSLVVTWRPRLLSLYLDGILRASSSAAATNTGIAWSIYRWGFSTSQDFNGDIALIACFASSPPWCGAGTPIRSASCAHGTKCLRSLAARRSALAAASVRSAGSRLVATLSAAASCRIGARTPTW